MSVWEFGIVKPDFSSEVILKRLSLWFAIRFTVLLFTTTLLNGSTFCFLWCDFCCCYFQIGLDWIEARKYFTLGIFCVSTQHWNWLAYSSKKIVFKLNSIYLICRGIFWHYAKWLLAYNIKKRQFRSQLHNFYQSTAEFDWTVNSTKDGICFLLPVGKPNYFAILKAWLYELVAFCYWHLAFYLILSEQTCDALL